MLMISKSVMSCKQYYIVLNDASFFPFTLYILSVSMERENDFPYLTNS